jgi:hypothetical protein
LRQLSIVVQLCLSTLHCRSLSSRSNYQVTQGPRKDDWRESRTRNLEPGARDQEPGTRNQKPGARAGERAGEREREKESERARELSLSLALSLSPCSSPLPESSLSATGWSYRIYLDIHGSPGPAGPPATNKIAFGCVLCRVEATLKTFWEVKNGIPPAAMFGP